MRFDFVCVFDIKVYFVDMRVCGHNQLSIWLYTQGVRTVVGRACVKSCDCFSQSWAVSKYGIAAIAFRLGWCCCRFLLFCWMRTVFLDRTSLTTSPKTMVMLVAGAYGGAAATGNEGKRDVMRVHGEWLIRTARPPVEQAGGLDVSPRICSRYMLPSCRRHFLNDFHSLLEQMVLRSLQLCTLTH